MNKYLLTLLILSLGIFTVNAQQYKLSKNSKVTVSGTSSLHDWTMTAEAVKGSGEFSTENNTIQNISDLTVNITAESLKSGKSGMDENAYKALKTNKHENITFTINSIKNEGKKMLATGKLTIAGVTRTINIPTDYIIDSQGNIILSGSVPIKMTDYKIDPPTAMFGTIKTGDRITINFKSIFTQDSI